MAVSTGPAVHSTAPTPRNSTCAPPRTEQAAGDGGNGVGVVPDAHRRVQRVLEVQARESMCSRIQFGNRRPEIGRASCRERVCQYVSISVVAVSLKKKSIKYDRPHTDLSYNQNTP